MANSLSGYEHAVISAVSQVNESLEARRHFLDSVYTGIQPIAPGLNPRTINIPFPEVSDWGDPGMDDVPVDDLDDNFVELKFENYPAKAIKMHDIERANHPGVTDILADYIREVIKKGRKYLNKRIASLFTAGNFDAHAPIACTGATITAAQFLEAQETLAGAEVETEDGGNMSLLIHPRINRSMKGDGAWTQAAQVSDPRAALDRQISVTGDWNAYQTQIKADVHVPVSGTKPARSFTCALIHRHAVAVGFRPLETPDDKRVRVAHQVVGASKDGRGGIPMRFQYWYEPLKRSYLFMADFGYGLKVIRPECGILFNVSES